MSKKIKKIPFRRNDDLRVLLTEVLPYEVPLPFSNVGFYKRLRSGADKRIIERCKVDLFKNAAGRYLTHIALEKMLAISDN